VRGSEVTFLGALAWNIPPLRSAFGEHLAENDGEILPHVLMSAYERWAEQAVAKEDPLLDDLLAQLEDAYAVGGPEVGELISVSFLEHLPRPGEHSAELRDRVGPNLMAQLRIIG
jgi:hypothetical protein